MPVLELISYRQEPGFMVQFPRWRVFSLTEAQRRTSSTLSGILVELLDRSRPAIATSCHVGLPSYATSRAVP